MKRFLIIVVALFQLIPTISFADEGMWLLALINKINQTRLKKMGFKLTPEDIYSINKSSIKDAVVGLGTTDNDFSFNCTSELISGDGLLLTNHHCGFDDIQFHSSVANNYVDDGFWAKTLQDELNNPGKTATFLIKMEDVSQRILSALNNDMTEAERETAVDSLSTLIAEETVKNTGFKAKVKDIFNGNQYFLFVYETYLDVRLVGAPPASIGKFGGDTDNWMWPRHTGDFSLFRIYTAPDGKPAKYSKDNVPLKSKHFFPISLKGINSGDFAMIIGYPGSTDRYSSSWAVEQTMNVTNNTRVKVRDQKLAIIKESMNSSKDLYIKYTSKYSESSNYWKYSIGQNKGLNRLKTIDLKRAQEERLKKWIEASPARKEKYGSVLAMIESAYKKNNQNEIASNYYNETMFEGPEIILYAYNMYSLLQAYRSQDTSEISNQLKEYQVRTDKFFKDFDTDTDKKLFVNLLGMFRDNIPQGMLPEFFQKVDEDMDGDLEKYAEHVYEKSIFANKEIMQSFLSSPDMSPLWNSVKIIQFSNKAFYPERILSIMPLQSQIVQQFWEEFQSGIQQFFQDFDPVADKKEFIAQFTNYKKLAPSTPIFKLIDSVYKGDVTAYADEIYSKSIFASSEKLLEIIDLPKNEFVLAYNNIFTLALYLDYAKQLTESQDMNPFIKSMYLGSIKSKAAEIFETLDKEQEISKFNESCEATYMELPENLLPKDIVKMKKKYKNDYKKYFEDLMATTILFDSTKYYKLLTDMNFKALKKDKGYKLYMSISERKKSNIIAEDPAYRAMMLLYPMLKENLIENDPGFQLMTSIVKKYREAYEESSEYEKALNKGERLFMSALMEMDTTREFYPDANSTMRLTFGTVGEYKPMDAVKYKHYTTLKGVIEKEDETSDEFKVPMKLKELYAAKDFGMYAQNNDVPVCFLTNNDITGGNSGSPVLNGNGELIGVAFDGNWEGMSGDIDFEENLQKTICVDIRYVLFIIDKYAGAKRLIDEMKIIK